MKKIVFTLALLLPVIAGSQALPVNNDGYHEVPQKLDDSVNKGFTIYFRTLSYASVVCTTPRDALDANLIANGSSLYGNPSIDAEWMSHKKEEKNCWQQPPDKRFVTTPAVALYVNSATVVWVAGIKRAGSDRVLGYIPIDQIQLIPIPTL